MSETESFEQALDYETPIMAARCFLHHSKDGDCKPCATYMADRLRRAHDREIRDVSQQQYDRGYIDGTHSMDAEHRAVAMRLRGLRFDGGSHENLSRIAYAIYPCATGWTCESADGLRDRLIDLLGGVSDDTCDSQCGGACAAGNGGCVGEQEVSVGRCEWLHGGTDGNPLIPVLPRDEKQVEVTNERAADDSGAAVRCGDGCGDIHMAGVTHELREFVDNNWSKILHETKTTKPYVLLVIADRIDEQFDRICQQQEAVLQKTIDEMVKEYEHDRESDQLRIEKLAKQRDEARARTDELSDELLRTRRERDEARDECDRLKRDMLDEWVPRTSYEEKVEKYRRAYMESDAWRKSLQEKLDAMRDAITAALNG